MTTSHLTSTKGMPMSPPSSDDSQPAPRVVVRELRKVFQDGEGNRRTALDGVSLTVRPGEFVVLLGPSGCGKTTLLRSVAGLESPDSGEIEVNGRPVFSGTRRLSLPPERRELNMVFQSYALWPHMTLLDNVAYPLRCRKVNKADARRKAAEMLELVGLGDRGSARPAQLSGGQQQRVALARAIVSDSEVVLFDEPLSNLDAQVRERLRTELASLQRRIGFTALYVTHDQSEAMAMADTVVVMNAGRIEQVGPPREVFERPQSRYVATFVGSANEVPGTVLSVGDSGLLVETPFGQLQAGAAQAQTLAAGDRVRVMLRPEHCELGAVDAAGTVAATIERATYMGGVMEYHVRTGAQTLVVRSMAAAGVDVGAPVWLRWPADRVSVFLSPEAEAATPTGDAAGGQP